jgi:arylsulfatase A-like enzyme
MRGKRIIMAAILAGSGLFLAMTAGERLFGGKGYRIQGSSVIFISIDTLRADHLGCYGYHRETSPNIDRFAAGNLLFDRHFVTMPTTLPSHTSMMTGLHPKTHGITKNGLQLDQSLVTIPEILRDSGFTTAGFVSSYTLHSDTGFSQGFDHFSDVEGEIRASRILEGAIPWIRENRDEKFFLFLHFFDPHSEYDPPEGYNKWGEDRVALYDGEINYVDDMIGRLFQFLKEEGLYDETLIILTSDHGESLGRQKHWGHGRYLYDEALQGILVIRFPSSLELEPRRIDYQTSAVDFLPTITRLLGIEGDFYGEGMDIFGEDIRNRNYIFAQRRHYERQNRKKVRRARVEANFEYGDKYAIREPEWKYILRTRYNDELYNLREDPGELKNILEIESRTDYDAGLYQKLIKDWLEETPYRYETDMEITDEVKEKLKSLGYIN